MKNSDVFRFAILRQADTYSQDYPTIELVDSKNVTGTVSRLINLKASNDLEGLRTVARNILDKSGQFTDSLIELDSRFAQVIKAQYDLDEVFEFFKTIVDKNNLQTLQSWKTNTVELYIVTIILGNETRILCNAIEKALRFMECLIAYKNDSTLTVAQLKSKQKGTILLPSELFPIPKSNANANFIEKEFQKKQKDYQNNLAQRKNLVKKIVSHQIALDELKKLYEKDLLSLSLQQSNNINTASQPSSSHVRTNLFRGWFGSNQRAMDIPVTSFNRVSPTLANEMSDTTKEVIAQMDRNLDQLNIIDVVNAIEKENAVLANSLYRGGMSGKVVKLGMDYSLDAIDILNEVVTDFNTHVPGICPAPPPEPPVLDDPTLPDGVGNFQSLGITDLMVVKQQILRYEKGEVAHIENVLKSEDRTRRHRTLSRTEEIEIKEVETNEEIEKDLETTERFELQLETEKTIESDSSREAGVTVSGSYGPTVEFTANAGYTGNNASSTSDSSASKHAREITNRAVQRLQERVRRERTTKTISEVEVLNKHGFINRGTEATNITGIYRWVDKIYQAQVFNYGKREIIEVVVPEPAALIRHFKSIDVPDSMSILKPEEPGYCSLSNDTFEPLEPKHISPTSYLFWTSRYNVQGVAPPPANFQVVGLALSSGNETETLTMADNSLQIPTGYVAKKGVYTGTHTVRTNNAENAAMKVIVGRHNMESGVIRALNNEVGTMPIAIITANVPSFSATVEIECELTQEAMNDWQLETFNAIMDAYLEQKSEHEAALQRASDMGETGVITGENPIRNREIEKNELKRLAISHMTGHHFDDFDAMRKDVPPLGYPQSDLNEAQVEGEYVRFIEQAFEWENMQYLFYPYYWANKKEWPTLQQTTDADPLFQAFLSAGSSRVNIPVRPGFETVVNAYLSTGNLPWNTDTEEDSVLEEAPFLSISEEMKSQNGPIGIKSEGTISISSNSNEVEGTDTNFLDDDLHREITFGGEVYMIIEVVDQTHLTISENYEGSELTQSPYSIGAKAVGVPWTVKIPTSLVYLEEGNQLPTFD
ncbi:MAG: hypothetical protein ACX93O_16500 [Flagellimonas sp.]